MDRLPATQPTLVLPDGFKNRKYEYKFRAKLEKAGLAPIAVDILTCRFVYDMSLRRISEELGVVSTSTVRRILDKGVKQMKKARGVLNEGD